MDQADIMIIAEFILIAVLGLSAIANPLIAIYGLATLFVAHWIILGILWLKEIKEQKELGIR